MKTVFGLLVLVCALSYQCVNAGLGFGKCKEAFSVVCQEANGVSSDLQCAKDMELPQVNCAADKNAEEHKKIMKEMKKRFDKLDNTQKKNDMECLKDLGQRTLKATEGKIPQECQEKFSRMLRKVAGSK